jgi:hypothetical protein
MQTLSNLITAAANLELFQDRYSNPKANAQKNLQGRTHYAEDQTLDFFKAKIVAAEPAADGLFLQIVESVALDYENTRRGFRVVVFDLFGQTVFRPSFEECASTKTAALNHFKKYYNIDPATYYRAELKHRANRLTNQAAAMTEAAEQLEGMPA